MGTAQGVENLHQLLARGFVVPGLVAADQLQKLVDHFSKKFDCEIKYDEDDYVKYVTVTEKKSGKKEKYKVKDDDDSLTIDPPYALSPSYIYGRARLALEELDGRTLYEDTEAMGKCSLHTCVEDLLSMK